MDVSSKFNSFVRLTPKRTKKKTKKKTTPQH
jgi:hypothetical protein